MQKVTNFFMKSRSLFLMIIGTLTLFVLGSEVIFKQVKADNNYFALTSVTPFSQNWTNTGLLTSNDNWSGVPSINGYRGDGLGSTGTDPQTILGEGTLVLDVNVDETNPNTFTTGGVAEFEIANPTIALQGSGTADAPYVDIRFNTLGCVDPNRVIVAYTVRDLEDSTTDATQQVALQYRIGSTGNYTNIPEAYIADATIPNATQDTSVNALLPTSTLGQSQVHLRIITTDAAGSDEWVGVDNISLTCSVFLAAPAQVGGRVVDSNGNGISKVQVKISGGELSEPMTVITSPLGYYSFEVPAGQTYNVSVGSKNYTFSNPTRVINVNDNVTDLNFTADAP